VPAVPHLRSLARAAGALSEWAGLGLSEAGEFVAAAPSPPSSPRRPDRFDRSWRSAGRGATSWRTHTPGRRSLRSLCPGLPIGGPFIPGPKTLALQLSCGKGPQAPRALHSANHNQQS